MRPVKSALLVAFAVAVALGLPVVAPATPAPSTADDDRAADAFRDYFASDQHRAEVTDTLTKAEKQITPACHSLTLKDIADFHSYLPAAFAPDGKTLESGLWLEIWNVDLCGKEKRRSVIFSVKDSDVKAMAYLPGQTNVDPILGRDLLPRASVSAQVYIGQATGKPCEAPPQLFDTKLVDLPSDIHLHLEDAPPDVRDYLRKNISEMWREDWYFRACGHVAEVKITFLVKITGGTTYNISKGPVTPAS